MNYDGKPSTPDRKQTCRRMTVHRITFCAMVGALYVGLTLLFAPISFGPIQFRAAEALSLLPFLIPETSLALFVGCLISNIFGGFGIHDIVLGSLATLIAAKITAAMPNVWLAALSPVVVNAAIVGGYLSFITEIPMPLSMLFIAASQTVSCVCLGIPLTIYIKRTGILNKIIK